MKKLGATAGLLLVLGCAPDSPSATAEPGDEATSETSPAQEDSVPPDQGSDGGGGEAQEVSVDLPGLPIGGSGAVFSTDAPTQCVDVNWTGPALPDGVGLEFTDVEVPPEFSEDATPCSDAPCVGGGYRITSATGGCTVSVTWRGVTVADPAQSVLRADAVAFCAVQSTCDDVKAAADVVNEQTGGQAAVRLTVQDSDDDTSEDPSDGTLPSEATSEDAAEGTSPSEDPAEGTSPSDDGSGG